ncbi:hypothetical protein [Bacillus kwashiorkori]|uniref:hypothetical protein n=1 Tax=Bacillus kwashiorkori TaxID=1522318 RepID=UPI0007847066|nr:hypothetical protein [Bacillus kwashiorkori]
MISKINPLKALLLIGGIILSVAFFDQSKAFASEIEHQAIVNNHHISISAEDYERLLGLGFLDNEIMNMDLEEYELNENLTGELLVTDTVYIKTIEKDSSLLPDSFLANNDRKSAKDIMEQNTEVIGSIEMTKEDFEKEVRLAKEKLAETNIISPFATDSYTTSYKTVTTSVNKLSNSTFRVKNNCNWSIMPKNRSYDVIGVALNHNWAGNKGSEYGKQTWKLHDLYDNTFSTGSAVYSTSKDASYWNLGMEGFSVKMNLKNDDYAIVAGLGYIGYKVSSLDLYMYYSVGKTITSPARIDAYGRYAHATTKIKPSFGFGVTTSPAVGFNFSLAKSDNFDITNKTVATLIF